MYVLYDDQRQDEEAYGYRKTDPEHDRRRKESRFAIERISAAFFIDKKFRLGVFLQQRAAGVPRFSLDERSRHHIVDHKGRGDVPARVLGEAAHMEHPFSEIEKRRHDAYGAEEIEHHLYDGLINGAVCSLSRRQQIDAQYPGSEKIIGKMRRHRNENIFRFHKEESDDYPHDELIDKLFVRAARAQTSRRKAPQPVPFRIAAIPLK